MVDALEPWKEFYIVAGGAGAVLLGLVFIGLSIQLDRRAASPTLVPLAVGSAVTLFYPVVISLLMLMPPSQPWLPSGGLVIVALFATVSAAAPIFDSGLRRLWYVPGAQLRLTDAFRFGVPWAAALGLIILSVWLLFDPALALYAVAMIIVVFLVVGTQNAWNVLLADRYEVGVAVAPVRRQEEGDE